MQAKRTRDERDQAKSNAAQAGVDADDAAAALLLLRRLPLLITFIIIIIYY